MEELKSGVEVSTPFQFRDLQSADVFLFIRIIGKLGIRECLKEIKEYRDNLEFKPPMRLGQNGELEPIPQREWNDNQVKAYEEYQNAMKEAGMVILDRVISVLPSIQGEVNALLDNGLGKPAGYAAGLSAIEYVTAISAFIERDGFTDFFTQCFNLFAGKLQTASYSAMASLM